MRCKNCTGIGEIIFMTGLLEDIPREERERFIHENAERLRREYCGKYCPVTKFYKKYGTKYGEVNLNEVGWDSYIDFRRFRK